MKRVIAFLLAVVCCLMPLTVSAVYSKEEYKQYLDHYLGRRSKDYKIEMMVPYVQARKITDPETTFEELAQLGEGWVSRVVEDGVVQDIGLYRPNTLAGFRGYRPEWLMIDDTEADRMNTLLERYGEDIVFFSDCYTDFVALDGEVPMVYEMKYLLEQGEQPVGEISPDCMTLADFVYCASAENVHWNEGNIRRGDGTGNYDRSDLRYAAFYWKYGGKYLDLEASSAQVYTVVAIVIVGIAGIVWLVKHRKKRKGKR